MFIDFTPEQIRGVFLREKTMDLKKQVFNGIWLLLVILISFALGWFAQVRLQDPCEQLVMAAQNLIANEALYHEQSEAELAYAAIRGMLGSLADPYAELIEPEAAKDFMNTFSGNTGVVGLYADNQDGQVVIEIIFPGGAAEAAGLQVGDVIVAIDGKPLDAASDSSETGLLMRGEPGSTVRLEILRAGAPLTFEVRRAERQFVSTQMLPEGIGYISLNAFNANAAQAFKGGLEALLALDPQALIWDLRSNEGGDMQAAQDILSLFIEDGLLFTAQLTHEREVAFYAEGQALAAEIPLVVLIDGSSYSAAETAAATIAETGRGVTVGSPTYGKGLIQATIPLADGSMLQLTIARWVSPSGEWYHQRGVPPQVTVVDDPATEVDEVLARGVELAREDD